MANRVGLNSTLTGNNGGLQNGLRHMVWQALLTRSAGAQAAAGAAAAHGDGDPNVGGKNPTPAQLDSRADTFNNLVGQQIGADSKNANKTPQQIALIALDKLSTGQARQVGDGTIIPTTMTPTEYNAARQAIGSLDTQGWTPTQAKERKRATNPRT